jgi:hypothetical protein
MLPGTPETCASSARTASEAGPATRTGSSHCVPLAIHSAATAASTSPLHRRNPMFRSRIR